MAFRPRILICVLATLALLAPGAAPGADAPELLLATTTSVRDSGLLDAILPPFTAKTGIRVKVIAVGSGAALEMARKGDADLVIAHAPDAEVKLVAEGALVARRPFAENYFLIAGPVDDPAHVKGAKSAVEAIQRIATAKAPFATRGDESGTHQRERKLFEQAGLPPDPELAGRAADRRGHGPDAPGGGREARLRADRRRHLPRLPRAHRICRVQRTGPRASQRLLGARWCRQTASRRVASTRPRRARSPPTWSSPRRSSGSAASAPTPAAAALPPAAVTADAGVARGRAAHARGVGRGAARRGRARPPGGVLARARPLPRPPPAGEPA